MSATEGQGFVEYMLDGYKLSTGNKVLGVLAYTEKNFIDVLNIP